MNILHQLENYADGTRIIRDWLGSDGVAVDQATAQRRADICIACPRNKQGFLLTETIAQAIHEQIEAKNHIGLRVNGEKKLLSCEVCSCVNRLQIWCPTEFLNKYSTQEHRDSEYPEQCWKRKNL